jgi:16S rRNA (guanine(966)-N(2))-methyltransferase RsmD
MCVYDYITAVESPGGARVGGEFGKLTMPIRVISGSAKGRRLKLVPGDDTRPVMDRVKEALFNIIGREVLDSTWLDLFAGTGSVGIEALSRGGHKAVFVELAKPAIQTIQANLEVTRLQDKAVIRRGDVFDFLRTKVAEPFDFVYIAPPQYKGLWQKVLTLLDENDTWTHPDSVIIVQIDPVELADIPLNRLEAFDQRRYGNTLLWFFHVIPARANEEPDRMELERLERIASELVAAFGIVEPPVPVEEMLQDPKPGMWQNVVNMLNLTQSFLTSQGPLGARMSLARLLARELAHSPWGQAHDLDTLLGGAQESRLYPFARMIVMPLEMVDSVPAESRNPVTFALRFYVPEEDARDRLADLKLL